MTIILSIIALLLTSGAAYTQTPQIERIRSTEYGIYTVDREIQGRDALGINKAAASNVRHAATLRNIPAQIGTTFGFRYEVMCKPHAAPVELRQVVIFPSPGLTPSFSSSSRSIIQDEFLLQTRIGETSYAFYTLEDAFELVPGSWVFEIWQGNRRLAMQVFKVITSIPDDGKVITSTADVSVITSTADWVLKARTAMSWIDIVGYSAALAVLAAF
jgi:hypothetical protein